MSRGFRSELVEGGLGFDRDLACFRTFWTLLNFEVDGLALVEDFEAAAFDRGKMNKNVRTAIGRRNETKSLGFVKPLDGTANHVNNLR